MKNSMVNTFFAALQNNPSLAAGSCTFAVAFALVAGNAFYAQSGNHPDPIWATRDATVTRSVSPEVRSVKVSAVAPKSIPIPQKSGNVASAAPAKSELVADIQAALMKIGGFSGTVDGLYGPLTRSSIMAYEKRNGLSETGEPTAQILLLMQREKPEVVKSSDPLSGIISSETATNYDKQMIQQIQAGIANSGIADIDADGIFGNKTRAAIMEFQKRNSLEVTGKPDREVLRKMQNMGLISQG